jgi:hypothetical protein
MQIAKGDPKGLFWSHHLGKAGVARQRSKHAFAPLSLLIHPIAPPPGTRIFAHLFFRK